MNTLSGGLNELSSGLSMLNIGANKFSDGVNSLDNGIATLSSGMSKFNQEGVSKICSYINHDVKDVTARLEKMQQLANEYTSFTSLSDDANGSTKFIMISDGIKKKEEY